MENTGTQYPYSIKFSVGTIAVMVVMMLILLSNTVRANDNLGWVLFGIFSCIFLFLLILLITTRLIPALRGDIALALDDQGISDYIRDVSINWEDIGEINFVSGRSASILQVDLKFESDYGSQLNIPLRWVMGTDEEIYETVMAYFENNEFTEYATDITIDDILAQLETIITESIKSGDRAGYFASLYYKVTAGVKEGIVKGQFENGARMEKFDVIFAGRYLDAYNAWKNKKPLTASWQVAFEAAKKSSDLVLQHLLLGMNAHINLDLGIAAVTCSEGNLNDVQNDFNSINTIISALTYEVLNDLDRVSPLLSLLGLHASNQTSVLIQFSIDNARDGAWCFAEDLAKKQGADYDSCISQRDETIKTLAQQLIYIKGVMRFTTWLIHLFEWKNVSRIIKVMHQSAKQKIVINPE